MNTVQYMHDSYIIKVDEDQKHLLDYISTVTCRDDGTPKQVKLYMGGKQVSLHRVILNIKDKSIYVDHINGNVLDCTRKNMRLCTNAQNQQNARPHKDKKSGLPKGVCYSKSNPSYPFQVRLSWNSTRIQVGYFKTVEEAEMAYKKAVEFYHQEFAYHKCREEKK